MIVENHIVYRVVPFDADAKEGESALLSKKGEKGILKQCVEDALEKHRPKDFPRRDECLFVCFSKENAYEWASIKYGKMDTPYKLLTLEITGDLYWVKADCYNFLGNVFTQEQLNNACVDYWKSITERQTDLILDRAYEGLFIGKTKVIAVENKNYINGESYDVE